MHKTSTMVLLTTADRALIQQVEALSAGPGLTGWDIRRAETFAGTLRLVAEHAFEAILFDPNLPDATGLGDLDALREAAPQAALIPVVDPDHAEQAESLVGELAEDWLTAAELNGPLLAKAVRQSIRLRQAHIEHVRLEERVRQAQKLESLGLLASGIAHDFNNLLVAILGKADLALIGLPNFSPICKTVQGIRQAALRAADLANQLLTYSAKGETCRQPIDLSALIREMAVLLKASIGKKVKLRARYEANLPAIEGDPTQIRQVVMNLITNASDAMDQRGGEVRLQTDLIDVEPGQRIDSTIGQPLGPGQYVRLAVRDTGCGMDEETIRRVFDPFFTTKSYGRGLGMSAVLGIVKSHGGAVRISSKPGKGTSFELFLPASSSPIEHEAPVEEPCLFRPCACSGTVLVIEDEEEVREVVETMLRTQGLVVATASDGPEGLEVFRRRAQEVSAVLLDLSMPQMSGEEVLAELRQIRPDVPVLLCTGHSQSETDTRLAGLDADGYIAKPFTLESLLRAVRGVFARPSRLSSASSA